jgi:hypothetical protein
MAVTIKLRDLIAFLIEHDGNTKIPKETTTITFIPAEPEK